MTDVDVVVAGAGHNSLIAAAYLARAGRRVRVLEAQPIPGGGAITEELLLPGYRFDTCSTGHMTLQSNPLLADDELGLRARYGLEYLRPDPFAHVVFPDGEQLTAWLDVDRTCAEIARFSAADAAAYRRLLTDYEDVSDRLGAVSLTPIGFGPTLERRLAGHPRGAIWLRRRTMSAWSVVHHEFESRHVRAFVLWQTLMTFAPIDMPGTGLFAFSVVFGHQRRSWTLPRGGAGRLTDALVACIVDHGGEVFCGERVERLLLDDGGRCVGVATERGHRHVAREAVLSTIHVKHLVQMAPADAWGEPFLYGVASYDLGMPGMALYLAASEPPTFATPDGPHAAVASGLTGWPEDLLGYVRGLRDGRYLDDPAWVLVGTPTLVDRSRAPHGHHTVKLVTGQAHGFAERKHEQAERLTARLRAAAPNLTDDVILASLVKAPEDIERGNEHMIGGAFHGGDRSIAQAGDRRPVIGWAQHRMPISGLYQTGGTTHPGGSITGAPGRNAATVLLRDLGLELADVVGGPARTPVRSGRSAAARVRAGGAPTAR